MIVCDSDIILVLLEKCPYSCAYTYRVVPITYTCNMKFGNPSMTYSYTIS